MDSNASAGGRYGHLKLGERCTDQQGAITTVRARPHDIHRPPSEAILSHFVFELLFGHHANRRGKIFVLGRSAGRPNLRCTPRHKSNSDPKVLANARLPSATDTRASDRK